MFLFNLLARASSFNAGAISALFFCFFPVFQIAQQRELTASPCQIEHDLRVLAASGASAHQV
jgi:hypothetical protein